MSRVGGDLNRWQPATMASGTGYPPSPPPRAASLPLVLMTHAVLSVEVYAKGVQRRAIFLMVHPAYNGYHQDLHENVK
jgi:hypothetical protein